MLNKEFTYIIVGLIIMLVMHVIEATKNEGFHINYESAAQIVGGVACFGIEIALWPIVIVNRILNKI